MTRYHSQRTPRIYSYSSYGKSDIKIGLSALWQRKYVIILEKLQKNLDTSIYNTVAYLLKVYRGVLRDSTGFDQAKAIIGRKRDSEPEKYCSLIE